VVAASASPSQSPASLRRPLGPSYPGVVFSTSSFAVVSLIAVPSIFEPASLVAPRRPRMQGRRLRHSDNSALGDLLFWWNPAVLVNVVHARCARDMSLRSPRTSSSSPLRSSPLLSCAVPAPRHPRASDRRAPRTGCRSQSRIPLPDARPPPLRPGAPAGRAVRRKNTHFPF